MKRKTKNEKLAEEIVHALRQIDDEDFQNLSDDILKGTVLSVINLLEPKPKSRKKIDNSWKDTRDQCS
jgi:hypothetical protein